MVRFFASVLGLKNLCFSYAVVNPYSANYYECMNWLMMCRDVVEEVIVDTAVHKLFSELNLVDYPQWYIEHYIRFVKMVRSIARRARVWYVIPDIPVDYPSRETLYPYNVEKTVKYIELFLERYVDELKPARPIAVVQGRKDDIKSVIDTYRRYEHLYNQFEMIGLGPTCSTKRWKRLAQLIIAFDRNVSKPFHSFGAHLKALEAVLKWGPRNFYSFDSAAFYIVNGRMVSDPSERELAFLTYLEKLKRLGIEVPRVAKVRELGDSQRS